jgi:biotin operon repressor
MYLLKTREQLTTLHKQIENKQTGNPEELGLRLGITDRSVKNLIAQLRLLGAEIGYCQITQTYYYVKPVKFNFGYEPLNVESAGWGGVIARY